MIETEGRYFGRDCPVGKVQVEFVGCPPSEKRNEYGWKPVDRAFIEVWVDGKRFRIDVGTFHDGRAERRGLHIVTEMGVHVEQTAMNAASVWVTP